MWGKTGHLPEHGFNQVSNSLAGTWYFQSVPQFSVCMMYKGESKSKGNF